MRRLIRLAIAVVAVLGIGVAAGFIDPHHPTDVIGRSLSALSPAAADTPHKPADPQPSTDHIRRLLSDVHVVNTMPEVAGYERSCRKNKACVFGPAWTDDSTAPLSHNGCDTRNDMLRQQLTQVVADPKSRGCTVISGVLDPDPYTGAVIEFRKGSTSGDVEIDHVFPLEQAWHSGASAWPPDTRVRFANDPANLLAVDGSRNSAKGSKPISEWLPPHQAYRCDYIARYLEVAATYQLPITAADKTTAERTC